ncbi:class E sortase [Streptomyces sp. NPDC047072]|uniref:class E sortase n=1 Tax=Streptomyces sp. NPDC047072 TaxID=3154809 RepID=UPI0033C05F85
MRPRILHHDIRRRRARRRRALWTGGELLVTAGAVLLLLVVHQLWWTNREAKEGAERRVEALEREWNGAGSPAAGPPDDGSSTTTPAASAPDAPSGRSTAPAPTSARATPTPSQAYAILVVPRLHLRVPVAEGVGKQAVLNKGYVGHYPGTQQPGHAGNFALAGHRNTHGEPFRYLNRLHREDTVRVETRTAVYTYKVTRTLPQTSSRDSGVIRRIPRSTLHPTYGYSTPGYYITLTTCTPEYTSRYRLVVWGELVSMRPRN